MIIRLSTKQFDMLRQALPPWLYAWLVEEGQVAEYGKKLEVLLLPDAWLEISDWVITRHLMSGGRRATPTLFDAVRRILKATNARQAHPAFHGQAVMGRNFEVLPAWEWWPEDREWSEGADVRTHWSPWIPSEVVEAVRADHAARLRHIASQVREPEVLGVVGATEADGDDVILARSGEASSTEANRLQTEPADAPVSGVELGDRQRDASDPPVVSSRAAGRRAVEPRPPGARWLDERSRTLGTGLASEFASRHHDNVSADPERNRGLRHSDRTQADTGVRAFQHWKPVNLWPEHSRKGGEVITEWRHSTMPLEGAVSENAYTRFINARAAAAGSPIT